MPHPSLPVAVIMQRTLLANRWRSEQWAPVGVVPDADPPATGARLLRDADGIAQWLHPGFRLELFRDEAEGYYLNVASPGAMVFVNWRDEDGPGVPFSVTVSYNEAARMMDGGARVDGVPLPAECLPWLVEFVRQHYRPEENRKRSRPPSFRGARRQDP
ncbi:MAG: DUF3305 domain-containing protein [Betaproteobacteria bacterium]|nr:DUF3305 domain-containing protein [Betaproteobacteria bacterium]